MTGTVIQREKQYDFLSFTVALIALIGLIATWHLDVREYATGRDGVKEQASLWVADTTWKGGWDE